jgi:DmsE family decaheme c-type cytochrome
VRSCTRHRTVFLLIFILAIGSTAFARKQANNKAKPGEPSSQEKAVASASYVGSDTCKGCHEDIYNKGFNNTPHWNLTKLADKHGCEDCHGPGSAHVEGGGDKTKIINPKDLTPARSSERCLTCHEYGEEHSNFSRSVHLRNGVSCISCHSVHEARVMPALLTKPQPSLCYGCHEGQRSEFAKPFRHRVNEGLLRCTDCHNVHGGFVTRQLRSTASQDAVCFKCHSDKAGPFVFEHVPVKTEGCMSCHQPHGSVNARLLRRAQVNVLCLECHTLTVDSGVPGIPSFHNQAQKYQACTLCHTQIHGSNFSEVFFK